MCVRAKNVLFFSKTLALLNLFYFLRASVVYCASTIRFLAAVIIVNFQYIFRILMLLVGSGHTLYSLFLIDHRQWRDSYTFWKVMFFSDRPGRKMFFNFWTHSQYCWCLNSFFEFLLLNVRPGLKLSLFVWWILSTVDCYIVFTDCCCLKYVLDAKTILRPRPN